MIFIVDIREWRTWSRRKSDSECGRPLPPPCRVNYHLDDRLLDDRLLDDGRVDDHDKSLDDRIDDRLVDRFDDDLDDSIDDPLL